MWPPPSPSATGSSASTTGAHTQPSVHLPRGQLRKPIHSDGTSRLTPSSPNEVKPSCGATACSSSPIIWVKCGRHRHHASIFIATSTTSSASSRVGHRAMTRTAPAIGQVKGVFNVTTLVPPRHIRSSAQDRRRRCGDTTAAIAGIASPLFIASCPCSIDAPTSDRESGELLAIDTHISDSNPSKESLALLFSDPLLASVA